MAVSGTSTSNTVPTARPVITWSVTRRCRLIWGTWRWVATVLTASGMTPRRLSARDGPDQQSRHRVNYDRHQEKGQPDLNQRGKVDVARGLAELIGQNAGHGV